MAKNGNGEVTGFDFQEIPLEEALNVVLAGDGSYSDVKQTLLEKLPTLPKDKAFAFGLPNGKEVPEDQRRGICMAINATLHRAKFDWRITYSGSKTMERWLPNRGAFGNCGAASFWKATAFFTLTGTGPITGSRTWRRCITTK